MNRFIEAIADHTVRSSVAAATAPFVAFAINCGGGDNKAPTPDDIKSPTGTVLRTESSMPSQTAMATQVVESPTPTATETVKPFKKLSEAQFKRTTFEEMVTSLDLAYEKHPDIAQIVYSGIPLMRSNLQKDLTICQSGDPTDPYPITGILSGCLDLTIIMLHVYNNTGYTAAYDAAVNASNYFQSNNSIYLDAFQHGIEQAIPGDTLPSQ